MDRYANYLNDIDGVEPATTAPPVDARVPDIESGSGYLVLHRVKCDRISRDGWDHSDHGGADYLDQPRLYANDTRGTALRGLDRVENWRDYWAEHPEYRIVVMRDYECGAHHAAHADEFYLIADGFEKSALKRLRPWLYRLKADTGPATRESEFIILSKTLEAALAKLAESNQPHLGRWVSEIALNEPYDYFYHFHRMLRKDEYTKQLAPWLRVDLTVLLNFIDKTRGAIFDEIDKTFLSGVVHLDIFDKLFGPNELVVTSQNGVQRALIAEKVVPTNVAGRAPTTSLECWSWSFDGSFRKKTEILNVRWPTLSERTIGIDRLSVQPLRVDKTGLRERLQQRGRKFWASRHKSLVCYNPPAPTIFELQIVSSLLDLLQTDKSALVLTELQTNPKYMIDYQTYRQMHPSKNTLPLLTNAEMKDLGVDMEDDEPPGDLFCLLLPTSMLGYAFHDKKWSKNAAILRLHPCEAF